MRLEAADARLPVEMRAQRRDQAEVVELQRPQAERELAHALERVARGVDALADLPRQRRAAGAHRGLELDLERGQRLPDVVVQVAREPPALFFLDLEEAAREGAQPLLRKL